MIAPSYRQAPSPLHVARAGASASLCCAFALVCVLYDNPAIVLTAIVAVVAVGVAAGVGREIERAAMIALPLAILFMVVNPLVYREGDTLLIRGGELLGRRIDVTLEAVAAGGLAGLRLAALIMAFGLFSACVDPDELLRLFRRVSYRSALTAALATRLVPVLARDATRMGDAARCRPRPPGRLAASALAAKAAGLGAIETYPTLGVAFGPPEALLCVLLLGGAALPFAGRAARLGVARA